MENHEGIALPLFSIRNPDSCGIGEFLDLKPLISWCKDIGFSVIQLLPLNDSGHDSSPYSAHSAMALHPIYLSLGALPYAEEFQEEIKAMKVCNTSKRVRYHKVLEAKEAFLKRYIKQSRDRLKELPGYKEFAQESWLEGYSRYKVLKSLNSEKAWWDWQTFPESLNKEDLEHHKLVQFLCFTQLSDVKREAERHGIFIKGDIPILLNRDSSDVWQYPEIFDLSMQAGAPPDYYADEGQKWGFPLYRWEMLEHTGYSFWRKRLELAQRFYHIYRLDHIVGFFRIWAIPDDKPAREGFFFPQDENVWIPQGEKILRTMLSSCSMLPIGEDLGNVPPSVRECMTRLGICGTKVMRWEKHYDSDRSFIKIDEYPKLSMTTLSTHDSETLEMWWEGYTEEAEAFCKTLNIPYTPLLTPETRKNVIHKSHETASLFHINLLQEYLDIFTELTWEDPEDDRINIPGTVQERNWTFRFKPTLQEIISHEGLRDYMRSCVRNK